MENERDNPKPPQKPEDGLTDSGTQEMFDKAGLSENDTFCEDDSFPAAPPPNAQPVTLTDLPKELDSSPIVFGSGLSNIEEIERQQDEEYPEMISGWGSGLANLEEIERQHAAYPGVVWPVVPWQVRDRIGSIRAYFMTVFYVLKRFGRIGNLMDGPVEQADARSFRRWTVFIAILPYLLTLFPAIGLWYMFRKPEGMEEFPVFLLVLCGAMVVCNAMFIYFQSAIVGWFFCPSNVDRPLQDRCISVSRYTIAPMALACLMILVIPIMLPFMQFAAPADLAPLAPPGANPLAVPEALSMGKIMADDFIQPVLQALGFYNWIMFALMLFWYIVVVGAAKSLARRSTIGVIATAVGVFILWIAAWLAVWMLPPTIAMWAIMFASLV